MVLRNTLNAAVDLFTADTDQRVEVYEGWECPHCDLDLSMNRVEHDGDVVSASKFCSWCGWAPDEEPDRQPGEAFELFHEHHAAMEETIERLDR